MDVVPTSPVSAAAQFRMVTGILPGAIVGFKSLAIEKYIERLGSEYGPWKSVIHPYIESCTLYGLEVAYPGGNRADPGHNELGGGGAEAVWGGGGAS